MAGTVYRRRALRHPPLQTLRGTVPARAPVNALPSGGMEKGMSAGLVECRRLEDTGGSVEARSCCGRLDGKVALVSRGARGIGAAIGSRLAVEL